MSLLFCLFASFGFVVACRSSTGAISYLECLQIFCSLSYGSVSHTFLLAPNSFRNSIRRISFRLLTNTKRNVDPQEFPWVQSFDVRQTLSTKCYCCSVTGNRWHWTQKFEAKKKRLWFDFQALYQIHVQSTVSLWHFYNDCSRSADLCEWWTRVNDVSTFEYR